MLKAHGPHLTVALLIICATACNNTENTVKMMAEDSAVELRVMSFNIEWGGTHVSFDNVVEAIRLADADVVGIQEAEGNLTRLATQLGWHYDLRNYIISRFPIVDPPGASGKYVYIELAKGKAVAIANVHLPSDPYGPNALRDGATTEEVLELERTTRLPEIKPYLAALEPLVKDNFPVFITGDLNTPAHTDPGSGTIGRTRSSSFAIEWPVSRAIAAAGFQDSWRSVYPDSAAKPGLTWWAARPPLDTYSPGENDPRDRIDFVWFAGTVAVQSSEIVGEEGGPEVTFSVDPWPSDHRAIVSQFSVTPAALPALVSVNRRVYRTGEEIHVRYRSRGSANTLSILASEGHEVPVFVQAVGQSGHRVLSGALFQPGHYRILLKDENEPTVRESEFWVLSLDAPPSVKIDQSSYKTGEPIEVEWHDAPGNRHDYVAVYTSNTAVGYGGELAWAYLDAMPEGTLQLDAVTSESDWPLQPGNYLIRMMKDDGYEQLAESSSFVVE